MFLWHDHLKIPLWNSAIKSCCLFVVFWLVDFSVHHLFLNKHMRDALPSLFDHATNFSTSPQHGFVAGSIVGFGPCAFARHILARDMQTWPPLDDTEKWCCQSHQLSSKRHVHVLTKLKKLKPETNDNRRGQLDQKMETILEMPLNTEDNFQETNF